MHDSRSLSESCRISILRLVSKSQWACFTNEVSSHFCSELGNTFIFQFKFLPFLACLPPARVPFYMCSANPDTPTCLPLTCLLFTFLTSLYLYLFFSLLFATMVCVPPSMFEVWQHCSHSGLVLWPHRNCGALVGSGGKQGGQG